MGRRSLRHFPSLWNFRRRTVDFTAAGCYNKNDSEFAAENGGEVLIEK